MRRGLLLVTAVVAAPGLWAGEYAVLTTGFRLRIERHVVDGTVTILHDASGGYSRIPTALIAGFEADDYVAPAAEPAATEPAAPKSLVTEAAERHGLNATLVDSVIRAESAYETRAVSPKGAIGLMQLMPATARELGVANALDPDQNVNGGTAYLRQMLDRYANYPNRLERALAAYNAGPARADRYGGLPPYRETVDFVTRVARLMQAPGRQPAAAPSTGLAARR